MMNCKFVRIKRVCLKLVGFKSFQYLKRYISGKGQHVERIMESSAVGLFGLHARTWNYTPYLNNSGLDSEL